MSLHDVAASGIANRPLLRRVGRFLALPVGVSGDVRREIELAGSIQRPLTRPVRIVVVGARPGVGRTTVARFLARTYAYLRKDRVILVDGVPDPAWLLLDGPAHPFDAVQPSLQVTDGGLWALAGVDGQVEPTPTLTALSRHFAVSVANAPTPSYDLVAGADALVLVTPATAQGLADARWRLSWLESQGLSNIRTRTVIVCAQRDLAHDPDPTTNPIVQPEYGAGRLLPYDEHLAVGMPDRVSTHTWSAALEIASEILASVARPA